MNTVSHEEGLRQDHLGSDPKEDDGMGYQIRQIGVIILGACLLVAILSLFAVGVYSYIVDKS